MDYGSRRQSYASDYLRRCSAESLSSRRTSIASNEADRRGSGSSLSSRRTSLASTDRRGSGSSMCSRRTSLLSDCTSRRSSGSSKSSRKGSNASSGRYEDTDELLAGELYFGLGKTKQILTLLHRTIWQFILANDTIRDVGNGTLRFWTTVCHRCLTNYL